MLAFLLVIGLSFLFMADSLTGLVSSYLYNQRIRQDSLSVEKLATAVAPLFQSAAMDSLTETMRTSAGEMGGRLLILNNGGKVQYDSYSELYGTKLQVPEAVSVLAGENASSYGIRQIKTADDDTGAEGTYVASCAAVLTGTRGQLGALLFVSPVDELVSSLSSIEQRMIRVFVFIAAAALLAALFFARFITRPISALTKTIRKMGAGDLSVRVPVTGSGELRQLAVNYNLMAEQLESLDKSRSQFVSNASHELKTPLTSMKLVLQSVADPEMPADLRAEFLHDMDREVDRLNRIITDLLTLSRMDDKSTGMRPEPTDASMLTNEVIRTLKPIADRKHQTIQCSVAPNLTVTVDPARMEQVLSNLIDNAIKYTPEDGIVTVRLYREGRQCIWQVEDTGIGIPAEDLPHVFERFYRVDKARSRESGGTGLGLSIVRQFVKLQGGEITAESTPGKGSVFTVIMPQQREKEAKE